LVSLPSSVHQYDYLGISLPKRFDLTLKLLDKSGMAEFMITGSNATSKYKVPVSIGNMTEIRFHNIGLQDLFTNTQTVTMKSPELNATGNITVNNLFIPVDERNMKIKGVIVPWQEVMVSTNGAILLLSVVSVTAIALWRLGRLRPIMK